MILIYSHHVILDYFIIFSSSSAINKMLYGGANFVPIAVTRFCLSVFFPNVIFNTTSAKSIMVSVINESITISTTIFIITIIINIIIYYYYCYCY